jgi:hypothetical protein
MSQLIPRHGKNQRHSLKAFLRLRGTDQRTTHCTDCGSICMQLPAQFWLEGDEETFDIGLPFCPVCNPELLSPSARDRMINRSS